MTAALVLLAIAAGAGWMLALALLIGGACRQRDAGGPQPAELARVTVQPGRALVAGHAPFEAQLAGVHLARTPCEDCRPGALPVTLHRRRWRQR